MTSPKNTRAISRQATSAVAFQGEEPDDEDPLLTFPPYIHKAPRSNSITPDLQRRFIAHLAATGIVKSAARYIGKSLEALYKLRHKPGAECFSEAWDMALDRGARRLEDIAHERAMFGTRTPIVSGGEILGWWDKPDNALLRFLLSHRLPTRYGPERETVTEELRRKLEDQAMEAAEEWLRDRQWDNIEAFNALFDHMVANRRNRKPGVEGLDKTKSLPENAQMILEQHKARVESDKELARLLAPLR
ncbi:hypothetical protein [Altererythrobacter sp. MF3-039]|uniref:hypothetical protein n=1 Tax=Altererythrobacter sp. MF3-039 TaxID=3252901 RepID=UPI00390C5F22